MTAELEPCSSLVHVEIMVAVLAGRKAELTELAGGGGWVYGGECAQGGDAAIGRGSHGSVIGGKPRTKSVCFEIKI